MKRIAALLLSALGFGSACGDVTSDLIESPAASDAGECSADAHCSAERPRCDLDSERCVQCLENVDCASDNVCALPAGSCVLGCKSAGCPLSSPICDEVTGLCHGCTSNDDCGHGQNGENGELCESDSGRCVECIMDSHCKEPGEECSRVLGLCAPPCESDDDCVTDDIYCDRALGYCVDCLFDEQCEEGEVCRNSECRDP